MPELPDVEGFREVASAHAAHRRVEQVRVEDAQVVKLASAHDVPGLVTGRYVGTPWRLGKWLVLPTSATAREADTVPSILLHFGMTGQLRWVSPEASGHPHDRVVFRFTEGELRYVDMRKLKGIWVAREQSEVDDVLGELGPDAYAVTVEQCRARLTRTARQLKSALLDQSALAGLGNLCVDEILWRTRIHPRENTKQLDDPTWHRFHRGMKSMLRQSSRVGEVPERTSWLTGHRADPAGRCPRCSTMLRHGKVAGRGTVWCPRCQVESR